MPSKKTKNPSPPPSFSMYPALHTSVITLLLEEEDPPLPNYTFNPTDTPQGSTKTHNTHIMGRFRCVNKSCASSGWGSKKIAITIRLYHGERYNARVWHQRCKACNWVSRPVLDHSYAERVAYRIKKWNGVQMEEVPYGGESKGPHNQGLCEGCKAGCCSERGDDWGMDGFRRGGGR
ncbi:zinc-binding domain-containing protein [Aspergillus cavernicola]|uniref:Zinc-binding domain-containing protein n=1 Tax=Aspergillus cavernicola TaxID=176166 RepID=A0ABR4IRE3_9EURO